MVSSTFSRISLARVSAFPTFSTGSSDGLLGGRVGVFVMNVFCHGISQQGANLNPGLIHRIAARMQSRYLTIPEKAVRARKTIEHPLPKMIRQKEIVDWCKYMTFYSFCHGPKVGCVAR